jgi:hypothetical protein
MGLSTTTAELERLRRAHAKVARLVVDNAVYSPVFLRLEAEIADAEAMLSGDILARARAVARQRASP